MQVRAQARAERSMAAQEDEQMQAEVGLCARCRHARRSGNARGSAFWQCLRAHSDARYARYPRLPMRCCAGFESLEGSEGAQ